MACSNSFTIRDKKYFNYYTVPCGFCLNCRVDRRNFLEDCCKFSEDFFGTSAFVCLTYDDYHLPFNSSLCRDDFTKFIKRLRRYLNYHSDVCDGLFIRPDFTFLAVGEYGDSFGRPHYHVLFFGLDSRFLEKILLKTWHGGIVDCGALDNGGIRYVLSYLEKNVKGAKQKELYDDNNLERPFCTHSRRLCSDFILSKYDEIMENNGAYKTGAFNRLRPIPQYWRKILCCSPFTDLYSISNKMKSHGVTFSLKNYNVFRHNQALLRQKSLTIATRNRGYPVPDDDYISNFCYDSHKRMADIINLSDVAFYGDSIPF